MAEVTISKAATGLIAAFGLATAVAAQAQTAPAEVKMTIEGPVLITPGGMALYRDTGGKYDVAQIRVAVRRESGASCEQTHIWKEAGYR